MKMRKCISAILVGVMAAASLSAGAYAEGDKIEISITGGGNSNGGGLGSIIGAATSILGGLVGGNKK